MAATPEQLSFHLFIDNEGVIRFLHDDRLNGLHADLADCQIRRASMVDPVQGTLWQADLSPSGGPVLGPFATRQEALQAETDWLLQRQLNP